MEINKQSQSAGDNAQQMQANVINVYQGITEQRAREIYSEMSTMAMKENTAEAESKALERINKLEAICIPRIEKEDAIFACFSDPAFQVLLKKAQLTAICAERENDYSLLSELLVHRIKNKDNVKKKASISKAVEIVDQIDDDSLCAITIYLAVSTFIPLSGKISEGIKVLSDLYAKINPDLLPKNEMWMDNLSILGAISIIPFSGVTKFDEILSKQLDGYVCTGIKKESEEYQKAIEILSNNGISSAILVDNELLTDYVRIEVNQRKEIDNLAYGISKLINGKYQLIPQPFSDKQKKCLNDVFDLYSKDIQAMNKSKENFSILLDSFDPICKVKKWWNSLSINIRLSSIGRVIAHTNAKTIDPDLPDLD